MRQVKFRGRYCQGIENAGKWVYWGINGTDVIDCVDTDTIGQFTGLFDKEGVEIYEGDIYNAGTSQNYQVYYKNGAFCGGRNYQDAIPLAWEDDADVFDGIIADHTDWLEVIGNVYENPELLEADK